VLGCSLGKAIHLAKDVEMAVDYTYDRSAYTPPVDPFEIAAPKSILLCTVLTGLSCVGNEHMREPSDLVSTASGKFDSTVDDLMNPTMYKDFQIHIEYVLTLY